MPTALVYKAIVYNVVSVDPIIVDVIKQLTEKEDIVPIDIEKLGRYQKYIELKEEFEK